MSESNCTTCGAFLPISRAPGMCSRCATVVVVGSGVQTKPQHPEQVLMAGGKVASSKGPPFHLIPTVALVGLAERFSLGEERKGDKAWNAGSNNQECLLDKGWLIERCSHIIHHAMKMRDILVGKEQEETLYENAGAVAWAGAFFLCAAEAIANDEKKQHTPVDKDIEAVSTTEKRSIIHGHEYICLNGKDTGPMVYFKQLPDGQHTYYSKNQSSVDWFQDGTPRRVNVSMTESELVGYTIPHGRLTVVPNHEGNIGQ